ncbi:YbjN domain-containing protein [Nostoc sp. MS1]|uniref:YbjN domain-containing protein n=1 Tax=Nostoc sp. MS1 TaxID=2764711 RepID=UPI001CC48D6F|nr:YbjN domain-containing protein [Nostoc sp. MS1]BCL35122.1 hypothetical protein NSMS1_15690 [Nostoc sp. MS1]
MNQIYDIHFIMSALQEAGWQPTQTDNYWLLIPIETSQREFFISFYCQDEHKMLSVKGNIPLLIPEEKESIILEFINYANYRIPIGNLELDINSRQVYFRIGLFFENVQLNTQIVHNLTQEVYQGVQDFWLSIPAILEEGMSIEGAFQQANLN